MSDYNEKRYEEKKEKMKEELIESAIADGTIQENDEKDIEELYSQYGQKEEEYLVDGAILVCDRATTNVKIVKGQPIGYHLIKSFEDSFKTRLNIGENATEINGVRMATIKDHEMGDNIEPFSCNCMILMMKKHKQ